MRLCVVRFHLTCPESSLPLALRPQILPAPGMHLSLSTLHPLAPSSLLSSSHLPFIPPPPLALFPSNPPLPHSCLCAFHSPLLSFHPSETITHPRRRREVQSNLREGRPTRCRVEPARVSSPQVEKKSLWLGQDPYSLQSFGESPPLPGIGRWIDRVGLLSPGRRLNSKP